jgi:hypothetical protein
VPTAEQVHAAITKADGHPVEIEDIDEMHQMTVEEVRALLDKTK